MKIVAVDPESPLFGYVRPGYTVEKVNGRRVLDSIDFRFKTTDDRVAITFSDPGGRELTFDFEEMLPGDFGLTFDESRIRTCKNDCIFCFIAQQPQGMRRILYLKDEDYRLSFTHGNFITLSNTSDKDLERIIEQRLSPLYISVHATDDTLRRCMLRNQKLAPIVPTIRHLTENGIAIHTQVVLCPGINDGPQLERTIEELVELYPGVESLAVVPVGLTKYREHLPSLRRYEPSEAREIIRTIGERQRTYLDTIGTRFVWPADEFYVEAEMPFPSHASYETMSQFENGIGMVREFITMFNRRRNRLGSLDTGRRALFLTGFSAFPFLRDEIFPYVTGRLKLNAKLAPVHNRFWGSTVTVSGLLTGQDLLREARRRSGNYDVVVLPPNCLNGDDLFLDNLSLEQFGRVLDARVVVGQYNFAETLKDVYRP